MGRIISFLYIMIAFSTLSFAQSAKSVLDKASAEISQSGGVSMKYQLQGKGYSQAGTLYLKGNKFKIESSEGSVWFDGKTQWAYVKSTNEVNVSNPDGEELAAISPLAILNLYKSGFTLSNKGVKTLKGRSVYCVEMKPITNNSAVSRYLVLIDKQNYQVSSIAITNKNKTTVSISITDYHLGLSLSDAIFVFDKRKFPRAEVVDLR